MRVLLRLFVLALVALGLTGPAAAQVPLTPLELSNANGFQPNCSAEFSVTNQLYQSNNFSTTGVLSVPVTTGGTGYAVPVAATFTSSNPVIAGTNNFTVGDRVTLSGTTAPTGFVFGTIYYVIATGLSSTQFELSASSGGGAMTPSSTGTSVSATDNPVVAFTGGTIIFAASTATATISSGVVTAIVINTAGSYSSPPTGATITGGGFTSAATLGTPVTGIVAQAPWTISSNNGVTFTMTPGQTAPDGTATATQIAISGAVTGSFYSDMYTATGISSLSGSPYTYRLWVQDTSGPTNGQLYIWLKTSGSTIRWAAIPTDGAWYLVTVTAPAQYFVSGSVFAVIGIDLSDAGAGMGTKMSATSGPKTINVWHGSVELNAPPSFPDIITTTAAVTTIAPAPCPNAVVKSTATAGAAWTTSSKLILLTTQCPNDLVWGSPVTDVTTHLFVGVTQGCTGTRVNLVNSAANAGSNGDQLSLPVARGVPIAFRDYTNLRPMSMPLFAPDPTKNYEAGGISNPYVNSAVLAPNGQLCGFSNATNTLNHQHWFDFTLWCSWDGVNWTEDTTNAPYLSAYGAANAVPTVNAAGTGYGTSVSGTLTWAGANCPVNPVMNVTTNSGGGIASATFVSGECNQTFWPTTSNWTTGGGLSAGTGATFTWNDAEGSTADQFFRLHPSFVPYGCTVSSVLYPYCVYWSSKTGSTLNIFMAYSATIDGNYTIYGCGPPPATSCATPTIFLANGSLIANPQLPTIVNVGGATGVNYSYYSSSTASIYFTSPAGDGVTLTKGNLAAATGLAPSGSYVGDWDSETTIPAFNDGMVVKNLCGYYEYYYTAEWASGWEGTNKSQMIGVLISNSPAGPWWKMPGPVFNPWNTLFDNVFLGDSQPIFMNGQFIWLGNFDTAGGATPAISDAVGASMPDACVN